MDDFERELNRTLHDRVAEMPASYDAAPELLARARRRRASKLGALVVAVVMVAAGTTAAVASVVGRDGTKHVISTELPAPTSTVTSTTTVPTPTASGPTVATIVCPVLEAIRQPTGPPPPVAGPRVPAAGAPATFADLASFAGTTGARYVVMGPRTWSCLTQFSADGNNSVVLYPPAAFPGRVPQLAEAPISVDNDYLWHGGVGSVTACSVFADPAVVQFVTRLYPESLPCPRVGRTVTRVDAHVSTFVDTDGARGAARIDLPSAQGGDGLISVLTCRPTDGLTAAECDTIIADYLARLDTSG